MNTELDALTARLVRLEADNAHIKAQFARERRRLRVQAGLAFVALVAAIFLSPANRHALAQGYGVTLANLNTRLTAVETKTQFVSVTGGEMYVKGTNLHIENGLPNPGPNLGLDSPFPPILNGKGNLIIGYNTLALYRPNVRTGSHNLIVGGQNNYSSYGGIVVGLSNTISAPYSSVTGGERNTASNDEASVSGGDDNTASSHWASVSGGSSNTASGFDSSISGGYGNHARGDSTAISGGGGLGVTSTTAGITVDSNFGWAAGGSGAGTFHSP